MKAHHWLLSKCCCFEEVNLVWKIFDHTTELYYQHTEIHTASIFSVK
jgi:hypothetical protein